MQQPLHVSRGVTAHTAPGTDPGSALAMERAASADGGLATPAGAPARRRAAPLRRSPRGLRIAEIFGPTFQGEGPSMGHPCSFVRLGGCNLACSWCDTPYTWDWTGRNGQRFDPGEELRWADAGEVWDTVERHGTPMLVVTGGEPLLQQTRPLIHLLDLAAAGGRRIEVETAGTIVPLSETIARVDQFNVSLKLRNSGNPRARAYRPDAAAALMATGKAVWKFVVQTTADLAEIHDLVRADGLSPVYVMPEGRTAAVINDRGRALASAVVARGWNLSTRLHIQLFGDRRGV